MKQLIDYLGPSWAFIVCISPFIIIGLVLMFEFFCMPYIKQKYWEWEMKRSDRFRNKNK